ncbi:MAG: hypothetical protein F4Z04_08050 [Acidobacteria bacterium]|nr:hypothetical protein [Acidobacteriota bacterium]
MVAVLGISANYHDAGAAVVVDGEIVAAAQEERLTRVKHDLSFPSNAIRYYVDEARVTPEDLDAVGFYEKPLLKLDRLLETYLAYAPRGLRQFTQFVPSRRRCYATGAATTSSCARATTGPTCRSSRPVGAPWTATVGRVSTDCVPSVPTFRR